MSPDPIVVYAHRDGATYVANFTEHGWLRWPATAHGWVARARCSADVADACYELPPRQAWFALLASGVDREDRR